MIRINVVSALGRGLIGRYGVRAVPTLVVLNGEGQATYQATGIPDREAVAAAVDALIDR